MVNAIKSLFTFQEEVLAEKQYERDEIQLAHDRALVSLSKLLHQCQISRLDMEEKLSSIWGPSDDSFTDCFADCYLDTDAVLIDTELACACDTLNSLTEKEHALQSEIYFTVRSQKPTTMQRVVDFKATESSFDHFKTNVTYAWRCTAQFVRGLAIKAVCLCLVKK